MTPRPRSEMTGCRPPRVRTRTRADAKGPPSCRRKAPARSSTGGDDVVGVGGDALAQLLVAALHVRVIAIDVLAGEAEELLVVRAFEVMAARALDGTRWR